MKFSTKKLIIGFIAALCVAMPVLADSTVFSDAMSGGGAYVSSPVTKKSSVTGAPALVQFTILTNYDNASSYPLAVRVRTMADIAATGVQSVYGTGTITLYYNSGYGAYGEAYRARVATHTGSTKGASFAATFIP